MSTSRRCVVSASSGKKRFYLSDDALHLLLFFKFQAQNDVDDEAAAEWRRQREAQLRAKRVEWTPEVLLSLTRLKDVTA